MKTFNLTDYRLLTVKVAVTNIFGRVSHYTQNMSEDDYFNMTDNHFAAGDSFRALALRNGNTFFEYVISRSGQPLVIGQLSVARNLGLL